MNSEVQFVKLLQERAIHLQPVQLKQFALYYELLVEWNEKMNLTAITDRDQVYLKHFYDSISLSFFVPLAEVTTMADIGAGAGFPSIPLKICYPHLHVTIVDSLQKRISFLDHLCQQLNLQHVTCVHARAEDAGHRKDCREQFDLVTARAVARLAVLNELCLPFVKRGGIFAAMKGSAVEEEVEEGKYSLKQLKASLQKVYSFDLPLENSGRHIVVVKKLEATPAKYSRKAGTPAKTPLLGKT